MTTSGLKSKFIGMGVLGLIGTCIAAALGADAPEVIRETFSQTAERWGIWAAVSLTLTGTAVVGLVMLVRFTMTTMRECIDDNSLSHLHLARLFATRKCLHDSDAVTPPDVTALDADQSPIGDTARRVLSRRAKRAKVAG